MLIDGIESFNWSLIDKGVHSVRSYRPRSLHTVSCELTGRSISPTQRSGSPHKAIGGNFYTRWRRIDVRLQGGLAGAELAMWPPARHRRRASRQVRWY